MYVMYVCMHACMVWYGMVMEWNGMECNVMQCNVCMYVCDRMSNIYLDKMSESMSEYM